MTESAQWADFIENVGVNGRNMRTSGLTSGRGRNMLVVMTCQDRRLGLTSLSLQDRDGRVTGSARDI